MADRKSLLSQFWPPSASRPTPTAQTPAAPPPATTIKQTPASQSSSQTNPTSSPSTPPRAETKTPVRKSTAKGSPSAPATPPRAEPQKASPKPNKSRSIEITVRPPLPSPSRVPPSKPKQASKPHSPSRATPHSPKGKQPASPSKVSAQPTEKSSTSDEAPILASKENDSKPAASQQEAEVKAEVKPDSAVAANVQAHEGTSFKHDDVEEKPSQSSQLDNAAPPAKSPETRELSKSVDSFAVNDGGDAPNIKLDAKREDVKEVVEATKTDEKKKEVDDSVAPKSTPEAQIVKKAEIPSEEDQIHREKHEATDVKEILATPGYATASQPVNKSNTSDCSEKPALLNEEHSPSHKNIRADHKEVIPDRSVSVITLAGENRGASMHMGPDTTKGELPIHIHRSYKSNPDQSPQATTDREEISKGKKSEDESCMEDQQTETYINNNAQGINNAIVFNSSIVEGSPGVHMVVNHLPKEPIQSKEETSLPEAQMAEVNMSRAEKLTYNKKKMAERSSVGNK
ncbi:nucleolar protein dao-5-like [Salvia splendens]|uniref:nucleolar protein dao-5-like n=1 Tax=Salvia splendens TaxID=180675 RepID=UPI001C274C83|nr:nucleolar protein dao-5-like [Salvia splendens]